MKTTITHDEYAKASGSSADCPVFRSVRFDLVIHKHEDRSDLVAKGTVEARVSCAENDPHPACGCPKD